MEIVKCEILWTRKCHLKCSYCAMATGELNSRDLDDWEKGIDNLEKLGCKFIAFYGAEPLCDFTHLPETIQYAEEKGIKTTVITSGIVDKLEYKLDKLYEYGLRSLTCSYDALPLDLSSEHKSSAAVNAIELFRKGGREVRDSAIVMTLTKKNYKTLPKVIEKMSALKIWTFFDFIHADRGQPGCKVQGFHRDLMFNTLDLVSLEETLVKAIEMKRKGFLFHTSEAFANFVCNQPMVDWYKWNCAMEKVFPAWVTINCDGKVHPCDDFQIDGIHADMVDLYEQWDDITEVWKGVVADGCPGCMWNTHLDACLIKRGDLPLTDYIHGE
jgi:MoaA/NifB/PqqE/SkfB family radical SAM enzyme